MPNFDTKPLPDEQKLGLGSCFAAGAMMLSHMNSSGLSRYDDLMADLTRLQSEPARSPRRADKPQATHRLRWVSWIYR